MTVSITTRKKYALEYISHGKTSSPEDDFSVTEYYTFEATAKARRKQLLENGWVVGPVIKL